MYEACYLVLGTQQLHGDSLRALLNHLSITQPAPVIGMQFNPDFQFDDGVRQSSHPWTFAGVPAFQGPGGILQHTALGSAYTAVQTTCKTLLP